MNCFSENITLNAGQHERTKSFSDIYTTKTTLKKFNFYVRENRQQGEEEIVAEAILGRGYTRALDGREREIKMHRWARRRIHQNSLSVRWASGSSVNSSSTLSKVDLPD